MRGDLLLPELGDAGLARLGADVGTIAATLAATQTERAGLFVDAELTIEPFDLTLPGWVEQHTAGLAHWPEDELAGLRAVAAEAERGLAAVGRTRSCTAT